MTLRSFHPEPFQPLPLRPPLPTPPHNGEIGYHLPRRDRAHGANLAILPPHRAELALAHQPPTNPLKTNPTPAPPTKQPLKLTLPTLAPFPTLPPTSTTVPSPTTSASTTARVSTTTPRPKRTPGPGATLPPPEIRNVGSWSVAEVRTPMMAFSLTRHDSPVVVGGLVSVWVCVCVCVRLG